MSISEELGGERPMKITLVSCPSSEPDKPAFQKWHKNMKTSLVEDSELLNELLGYLIHLINLG